MNAQLTLLAARRERLVAAATVQRQALVDEFAHWDAPLQGIERALARLAWARQHLHWLIAAGAVVVASPVVRGWLVGGWQLWRAVRRWRVPLN
ncbi:MAG: YqjK family protein [Acidobacteriota bacterium]